MSTRTTPFSSVRRHLLKALGLGALGSVGGTQSLFAKQFVGEVVTKKVPDLVYDPELQMMVDPLTRLPVYDDPKKIRMALPTVTAGCKDCPKCDDDCQG